MGIHSSCQWTLLRLLASLLTHCAHITSYFRLKSLRDELDKLEDKLKLAERNVTSLEAQRKAAVADKGRLSKQVTYQHLTVWVCVTYPVYEVVLCETKHYSVGISITSSRVPRSLTFIGSRARMCSDVYLCIFKKGISSLPLNAIVIDICSEKHLEYFEAVAIVYSLMIGNNQFELFTGERVWGRVGGASQHSGSNEGVFGGRDAEQGGPPEQHPVSEGRACLQKEGVWGGKKGVRGDSRWRVCGKRNVDIRA